jgi:hypothetical protein
MQYIIVSTPVPLAAAEPIVVAVHDPPWQSGYLSLFVPKAAEQSHQAKLYRNHSVTVFPVPYVLMQMNRARMSILIVARKKRIAPYTSKIEDG